MNVMNFKRTGFYFVMLALATSVFTGCSKDDNDGEGPAETESAVIEGKITSNMVLDADKTYLLKGYVQVMDGGSLDIPAGTVIKGDKATKAALIVERGGKIYARGTASNPVVFTSDRAAGTREKGDWAGVIICGKSTVNTSNGTSQYEGGTFAADIANYGGNVPDDNSGIFAYVRIEYAGFAIDTDKEINGLTLCGVGSGTEVHHVQVSYGQDDSFEFFGGTVNAHHLIAYRGLDDDFDFDLGYAGKLQYGISIKDPAVADAAGTSRGIELENKGGVTGERYTRPVISNFTFIGPGANAVQFHGAGIHFGQNSRMVLANSIIVNARGNAVEFNTEFPAKELKEGRSAFMNNLVFGNAASYGMKDVTAGVFVDVAALGTFMGQSNNTVLANLDAAGFNSTALGSPNLMLKAGSPALGKASFTSADLATGFTKETFLGAMGTTDWTAGWANWDPNSNAY